MHLLNISILQLSNYKVFIGHSINNTMLLSSWLIFSIRSRITILNLYHTIKMLKLSYVLLKHVINSGFPFWFVNFDLTKEDIIKYNAWNSGEFYVTRRWIRGLLSNFFVITKEYRRYLIKKNYIDSNKVRDLFDKWVFTRFTWPRVVFISNVKSSFIVSKEAASGRVPVIALVDTDVKTFLYNIPVACNDDSIDTIGFMNGIMSQYILRNKYKKILIWYYFNRNVRRFKTIIEWLNNLIKYKKNLIYKINIKNIKIPHYVDHSFLINKGLNLYFGRSYNLKLQKKEIQIENNSLFFDFFYSINKILLYNRFNALNYKNLLYKYRLKFRRWYLLRKIEGVTSFKSFLNNFIRFNSRVNRYKRITIKKRYEMKRKSISRIFKPFFHFVFFFFLNKFNIVLDTYNKKIYNLLSLIKIYKSANSRRLRYKNNNKQSNIRKYKYTYMFRYKSEKKYRMRKKKYGYIYNTFNEINKGRNGMSFLFFYWKYFVISLGLKTRKNFNLFKFRFKKTKFIKNKNKNIEKKWC